MKIGPGMPIEMIGVNAFGRYPKINTAATYNMMVTNANGVKALIPQPGYTDKISYYSGEPRGAFASTRIDKSIQVISNNVYLTDTNLNYRLIGQLDTYGGPVFISENQGSQISAVDGGAVYTYNYAASSFTKTTLGDFLPSYIDWLDTYTILTDKERGEWQISDSNNATSYDPLMRAPMQTQADNLQAVVRLDRSLYAIGKKCTERWFNNPNGSAATALGQPVSFPFTRDNTTSIDYGCVSTQTIQSNFKMLIFLGSNGISGPTVIGIIDGRPTQLSDEGLQFFLSQLDNPEDSWAILFKINGRILYLLTFPTDNISIVYDFSEKGWYFATDENGNYHIAKRVIFFDNRLYILNADTNNPKLSEFDTSITTYNGKIIPRTRILPPVRNGDQQFISDSLKIPMEYGEGNNEHRIDLSLSNDGGESYGNVVSYTLQPAAYRRGRTQFYNLGMSNDLRIQLRFWTLDRFTILGGILDARAGL